MVTRLIFKRKKETKNKDWLNDEKIKNNKTIINTNKKSMEESKE